MLVAGYPVAWPGEARAALIELLRSAGVRHIHCVAEPVGAAFYFLANGLTAKEFLRDVAVVDWGAGTWDLSVMRSGRIQKDAGWGSALYGGRLFDDLVFQWLVENVRSRGGHEEDLNLVLGHRVFCPFLRNAICRRIKKSMSRSLTNGKTGEWEYEHPVAIGHRSRRIDLGYFVVPELSDLLVRARRYIASEYQRDQLSTSLGEVKVEEEAFVSPLMCGKPVDLIAWGSALLDAGMENLRVSKQPLIILTGGSSNFLWFKEITKEHPLLSKELEHSVYIDGQPEMTIARGLGRVYAIGGYALALKRNLGRNEAGFVEALAGRIRGNSTRPLLPHLMRWLQTTRHWPLLSSGCFGARLRLLHSTGKLFLVRCQRYSVLGLRPGEQHSRQLPKPLPIAHLNKPRKRCATSLTEMSAAYLKWRSKFAAFRASGISRMKFTPWLKK